MTEQPKPSDGAATPPAPPVRDSFYSEVLGMFSALWSSRERNEIMALATGLVVVVGATAYAQVRLNAWNQPFYNALSHKDFPVFVEQLFVFAELAGVLLILNVAQMWLNQTTKVVLRQGLVSDLMSQWLSPTRAFRLSNAGEIGANPDQRIQQDAWHLTDLTTDLGIGLLQSTLLLLSFIGVLWLLSNHMALVIDGRSLTIPGYMVWCALLYAGLASLCSWWVGHPLVELNAEHYKREAEFRFALVRINENIDGITLYRGETDERRGLDGVFNSVLDISRQIVGATTRLTWVTAGYGWFTIAAPILVAAPAYFSSSMSFGELMMVVGAFNQVQNALRWYVDNFSGIADWRATLLRVASFRKAVVTMDDLGHSASRINFAEGKTPSIQLDDLHIAAPSGCVMLSEKHANLDPGERVLVTGQSGEEKSLLFRAVGGLWPWGSGQITHPPGEEIMFMPVRAYVPPGTLRRAIAYPHANEKFDPAAVSKAFTDVGLGHLEPHLDKEGRWDRDLTDDEKQLLAFARVLVQKPRWVVLHDALDALEPNTRLKIEALFGAELNEIGVINIGHDETKTKVFGRTLHLVTDPAGMVFKPAEEPAGDKKPETPREVLSAE